MSKRTPGTQGRSTKTKTEVLGMRERDGETRAFVVEGLKQYSLLKKAEENIKVGSKINTDEYLVYNKLCEKFDHESINHKANEYVRGDVTTNGIESVWAVLKRGMNGVYHGRVEKKHLSRYVNEFSFRLNEGNVERTSQERIASILDNAIGKRLTFKELTKEA
jgi:hypothetical protein